MMDKIPVITIDGPSGVGKSTICKLIANELKWNLLDSGAIYRSLVFFAMYDNNINIKSENNILKIINNFNVSFILNKNKEIQVILNGRDVTLKIRTQEISKITSYVSSFPKIRNTLLTNQRNFRKFPGLVADGRDMGTVVFPNASIKFFLNACLEYRTNRRMIQLQKKGLKVKFKDILKEMKERDKKDSYRLISPLIPAVDALILDTTHMSLKQVFLKIIKHVRKTYKIAHKTMDV